MKIILFICLIANSLFISRAQWNTVYQTPAQSEVIVASSPDDNTFWFITNLDVIYKTSNGGSTWEIINNPAFLPFGLFVLDNDNAFKTSFAKVWKTTNGGNLWTAVFSSSGSTPPNLWMKNNSEGVFSRADHSRDRLHRHYLRRRNAALHFTTTTLNVRTFFG